MRYRGFVAIHTRVRRSRTGEAAGKAGMAPSLDDLRASLQAHGRRILSGPTSSCAAAREARKTNRPVGRVVRRDADCGTTYCARSCRFRRCVSETGANWRQKAVVPRRRNRVNWFLGCDWDLKPARRLDGGWRAAARQTRITRRREGCTRASVEHPQERVG